jgi:23S rRNA A2030 N6-methylase RlmJ
MNGEIAFKKEEHTAMNEVKNLSGEMKKIQVSKEEQSMTFVDKTYSTKSGLKKFLSTLTPSQLAQAQVLVDDDTYVVFYPVVKTKRSRAHFDTGDTVLAKNVDLCPQPVVEVNPDNSGLDSDGLTNEERALNEAYAILLAGIKL